MARRSGLGKGLGALIPSEVAAPEANSALRDLLVSQIDPNPLQPRSNFEEEALVALTASVRELGVLQPVLVRPVGERFELIAGERRWRAAKRAGLQAIPAVVREIDDTASLEQAVVENLHRQDLNPLDDRGLQAFPRRGRSSGGQESISRLQYPAPVPTSLGDPKVGDGVSAIGGTCPGPTGDT